MENNKLNEKLIAANIAVWGTLLVLSLISITLTGCGSTTGWNVSFGVNPVNYVADQQGLVRSNGGAIVPAKNNREGY